MSILPVTPSRRIWLGVVAGAIAGGVILTTGAWMGWFSTALPEGVSAEQYARTAREFRLSQRQEPEAADVFFRLGMGRIDVQDWNGASACFAAIPRQHTRYGQAAAYMRAQALLQMDRMSESEQLFRSFLDQEARSPSHWVTPEDCVQARRYLSLILALQLRLEERRALLWDMIERDEADLIDTLSACYPTLLEWNHTTVARRIENACGADPHNVGLRAVLSQYRLAQGRVDEAQELLEGCRQEGRDDLRVRGAWLAYLYETADWEGVAQIVSRLPPPRDDDPWLLLRVRGQSHLHAGEFKTAGECFQSVLAGDPANAESHLGLARACQALQHTEGHARHLGAADALARIQNRLGWATAREPSATALVEIAELSWKIGLNRESRAVVAAGVRVFPEHADLRRLLGRFDKEETNSEGLNKNSK